eukprot:scaffold17799_cov43-Prasinocladus_malaysianus.AAC.2
MRARFRVRKDPKAKRVAFPIKDSVDLVHGDVVVDTIALGPDLRDFKVAGRQGAQGRLDIPGQGEDVCLAHDEFIAVGAAQGLLGDLAVNG